MEAAISRLLFSLEKSAPIFLSVWAIRYKAGWDYKLSPQAASLRWIIALVGYLVAVSLPGDSLAYIRVFARLVGLSFLCWPNLAYHLDKRLRRWPSTQGMIISRQTTENGWNIGYNYFFKGERYGGMTLVRPVAGSTPDESYPDGKQLTVSYDPYNPNCSKLI